MATLYVLRLTHHYIVSSSHRISSFSIVDHTGKTYFVPDQAILIEWVITNDLDSTHTAQVAQEANDLRWEIEQFHRELKQLTESEKCQCRKQRAQRNHLACCYHVPGSP